MWPLLEGNSFTLFHLGRSKVAAKRYWEVAAIRRFNIYVNICEVFGTEGQWPLSGGGRYSGVAAQG